MFATEAALGELPAPGRRLENPSLLVLATSVAVLTVFSTYLSGMLVQSVQAVTMIVLLGFFICMGHTYPDVRCAGWNWILVGLNLIVFGSMAAMVQQALFGGQVPLSGVNPALQQWLEQVVGIAVGFTILGYGFYRWIPSFLESKAVIANYLERTMRKVETQQLALVQAEEKARLAEERARWAEDLRRLKEFNDLILATIPSGLVVVDTRGTVLSTNGSFGRTIGLPDADFTGKQLETLLPQPVLLTALSQMHAGNPSRELEVEHEPRPGVEKRLLHITLSTRSEGVNVLSVEDVTTKRQAELMEKQLALQIVQSEKLSSLGELVSGVAHELNNPLSVVSGYAELLIGEEIPQDMVEPLREIQTASMRCKRIVNNLLTFARQHKPEREFTEVNRVLEDALALREYQFRVENIKIVKDLGTLPATVADPYQLQQVFFNVINNAYQAMKGWNGSRRLLLRTRSENGFIRVDLHDSGPGMPQDVVKRIFNPFFTTKKVGEGTGLGLSISFGIVREHGGSITASSVEGEGSCFQILLPVTRQLESEAPRGKVAAEVVRPMIPGRRVLVVDDEERIAEICRLGLERIGCKVDHAVSGDEALAKLATGSYEVVITDMRMPGVSGKDIYERLLSQASPLATRMIFITGDTVGEETRDFLEKSGNVCLVKPFGLNELEQMVVRMLQREGPETLHQAAA